ncbi:MAG: helix-turn-helix transcriptional regulator [Flavobacterium sp. JAD_PAG50586_2]|nr:MAG: helix-turn-helix transcriptional regulator [Flavobacterium sp. JAD_PAG50586_2]
MKKDFFTIFTQVADFLINKKNNYHKIFIMKKTDTLSALLGLTQGEMALLLRVHPSQWSMYESGRRNIPLKAKQVLSIMLGFLKFEGKSLKVEQQVIETGRTKERIPEEKAWKE